MAHLSKRVRARVRVRVRVRVRLRLRLRARARLRLRLRLRALPKGGRQRVAHLCRNQVSSGLGQLAPRRLRLLPAPEHALGCP